MTNEKWRGPGIFPEFRQDAIEVTAFMIGGKAKIAVPLLDFVISVHRLDLCMKSSAIRRPGENASDPSIQKRHFGLAGCCWRFPEVAS